jgi:putative DNA primase/helicase
VRERIGQAGGPQPNETPAPSLTSPVNESHRGGGGSFNESDWESQLQKNKDGFVLPTSPTNLRLFMKHHADLQGVFRFDSFAKRIIVAKCPPWENVDDFNVRPIADYDYFRLECFLETTHGLKATKNRCADSIESTAQLPGNAFNPASDYFNSLEWDGVKRIDTWLQRYVSDGKQPSEYLTLVGRKFLCGLAARAMRPGIKFDTMIILEGKQYAGKSFLSLILATINGEEYFLDDFRDIDNKDALMKMQGKLVIEFPEMNTMRKAEVNDLKAFISRTHDVFRPPYGRNTIESPRQCVFVGTINPDGPYLRDVTGNRRYWPVSCRENIDLTELKKIVPLLHAEAAHCVKMGEQLWITRDEYKIAALEQDKRVVNDVWIDTIQEILLAKCEITTDEILQALEIPKERRTPQIQSRVGQTMTALGWEHARLVRGAKRPRGFIKPEYKTKDNHEMFEEEIVF